LPDDLYERDILTWSEHQADLLRRVALGELVNGVDWEHVVEAIEDMGLSQLNAVESYVRQLIAHLSKVHGWPDWLAVEHWRDELVNFQDEAEQRYVASMPQRIDLDKAYGRARRRVLEMTIDGRPPLPLPEICLFTFDQLLNERGSALEAILANAQPAVP
jgi:hypothetical protein